MQKSSIGSLTKISQGGNIMPSLIEEASKEVIVLNDCRFKAFEVLRKHWDFCLANGKSCSTTKKDVAHIMQKAFPKTKENKSLTFFWNLQKDLVKKNILIKKPRTIPVGEGSAIKFDPNWDTLNNFDVVSASRHAKNKLRSDPKRVIKSKQPKKALLIRFPKFNKRGHDSQFEIIVTKSKTIEKEDFKNSTLSKTALRFMFPCGAKLKVVAENKNFSVIIDEPMECFFDRKEMIAGKAYPVILWEHALRIEDVKCLLSIIEL